MSVRVGLVVLSLALFGFAPAPWPKTEQRRRDNPADLTGTWAFTLYECNGTVLERDNPHNHWVEMTRDRITFHTDRRSEWTLTLNPNASPPSFTWGKGDQINYAGSY